jgi:arylsulfatase A-like enzyme
MTARRIALLLLLAGGLAAFVYLRVQTNAPPTVVLISIDTLRPERLGVYGGTPGTSPHIDELAKQSIVYEQVLANSPWTLPSHMTMLTGLDPVAHGVRRDGYRLSGHITTLAETLRDAGFRTGGFTGGGFVRSEYGFGQGFEVYRESDGKGFEDVLPEALDWLRRSREPTFLFLHTFDVHAPYDECDPETLATFRARPVQDGRNDHQLHRLSYLYQQNRMRVTSYARFGELLNDYDAGVHMADEGVGELIAALEETGRLENALILVTSDHGESFADHGVHIGHGIGLTDDELHVPLLVRLPHGQHGGKRIGTLADLVDVAPTVLGVLGVSAPPEMSGENLVNLASSIPRRRDWVMGVSQNTESYFLVKDGFKFILSPSLDPMLVAKRHLGPMTPPAPGADPGEPYELGRGDSAVTLHYDTVGDPLGIRDVLLQVPQLYDRARDPLELDNLWKRDPARIEAMSAYLKELYNRSAALRASMDDGQSPQLVDKHVDAALEQLGYLGTSNPTEQRASLDKLPASLRDPLKHPYEAPDIRALIEADQVAQFTRRRLESGLDLPQGAQHALQELGNKYVSWAVKNPAYVSRVRWRVEALTELAAQAGVTLDMEKWRQRFIVLEAQAQRDRARDGKQHEAPGSTSTASPPGADLHSSPAVEPSPAPASSEEPRGGDEPRAQDQGDKSRR